MSAGRNSCGASRPSDECDRLTLLRFDISVKQTQTISCKLKVDSARAAKLDTPLDAFGAALNWVNLNTPSKIRNAVKLQSLCYHEVRARFGLSSNLTCQVFRRVSAARKTAAKKNRPVESFRGGFATYDARIFSFRERDWTASLTLVGGRERFELALGNYQRGRLKGTKPKAATLVKRNDGSYYLQICVESEPPEPDAPRDTLGVDLGRTDIAHTSEGDIYCGRQTQQVRDHFAKLRATLQRKASKGTRSTRRRCRQLLKRLSGRERRFQTWVNHTVSKRIVADARRSQSRIALEDLTGIRQRTNKQRRKKTERRRSNSWAFYQLRQFIAYKALAAGVEIVLVNPRYTSQTCHKCLHVHPNPTESYRRGKVYECGNCGWRGDADYNGARNIRAIGGAVNRPGGPWLACELAGGLLKARALPKASVG